MDPKRWGHDGKNRGDQKRTRLKNAISSCRRLAECGCDSGMGQEDVISSGGGGEAFPFPSFGDNKSVDLRGQQNEDIYRCDWTHPFVGDVVHQSSRSVHRSHAYYASRAMRAKGVEGRWVAQEEVRRRRCLRGGAGVVVSCFHFPAFLLPYLFCPAVAFGLKKDTCDTEQVRTRLAVL